MTTQPATRVSLCKHSFPVQPPHGSMVRPGNCTGCGITYAESEAELRRQEEALIVGTSHYGTCPDCHRPRRLFRYQPQEQPWHAPGTQMPVGFLCAGCWHATATAENAFTTALFQEMTR